MSCSTLETYIKRQSLRSAYVDIAKALQKDTEESLGEAEALMAKAQSVNLSVFDPGIRLSDKKALAFLDMQEQAFPTGIPELDRRSFGPTRKELWHFIANTKSGKSWMLIQLAKMTALHRLKICHISLEMFEGALRTTLLSKPVCYFKAQGDIQEHQIQEGQAGPHYRL